MDFKTKEYATQDFCFWDWLLVNKKLSHALYKWIDSYYPEEPINPKGFQTMLYLAWLGYSRLN